MLDQRIINSIKDATVAIGLIGISDRSPRYVIGSGFIFDPKGYVMTAGHVAQKCYDIQQKTMSETGEHLDIAVFRAVTRGTTIGYNIMPLNLFTFQNVEILPPSFAGSHDLDVAYGKPAEDLDNLPFLKIKDPYRQAVSEEIILCGYPGGDYTLSLRTTRYSGARLSPVMQFGKISGLMPTDDDPIAYGIQTDIVSVGGSSGSPILNYDGEVIGLARSVILSYFESEDGLISGYSKIGLVHGVSIYYLSTIAKSAKNHLDTGTLVPPILPLRTLTPIEFTRDE